MIDALINVKLIKDTVLKTAQSGNAYTNFLLSVHVGEPQPIVVSGIPFGDVAERIAKLVCKAVRGQWQMVIIEKNRIDLPPSY